MHMLFPQNRHVKKDDVITWALQEPSAPQEKAPTVDEAMDLLEDAGTMVFCHGCTACIRKAGKR